MTRATRADTSPVLSFAEHGGDALIAQKEFAMGEKLWSKADPGLQKPRAQSNNARAEALVGSSRLF